MLELRSCSNIVDYVGTSGFDRERSSRLRVVAPAHVKTGNNTTGEREVALAAA